MTKPENADAYIASFPKEVQALLEQMRAIIRQTAPTATEMISYGILAYKLGVMLVWFAAQTNHIGLYSRGAGIEEFEKELAGYKVTKGTIQFPLKKPLPLELIAKIVKFRVDENLSKGGVEKESSIIFFSFYGKVIISESFLKRQMLFQSIISGIMRFISFRFFSLLIFIVGFYEPVTAQDLPDSIVIIRTTFMDKRWADTVDGDSLFKINKTILKRNVEGYESNDTTVETSLIVDLMNEINDPENLDISLKRFGIDTDWVKKNPEKLLLLSSYAKRFKWNKLQKDLILKELVNVGDYKMNFARMLASGCCYEIDRYFRYQYTLYVYKKGRLIQQLISRKYIGGHMAPWTDRLGRQIYSFKIDDIVNLMLANHEGPSEVSTGKKLLSFLANEIVEENSEKLNRLAPYDYQKEIDELSPTFSVVSYNELTGYGGYHGDGPLIEVKLHNPNMLPNLNIRFLANIIGTSIYPRDSVIDNYKPIVDRVESIKFLTDYLNANPQASLDILYFNNKPINEYNIEGVNKTPKEWEEYEQDVKRLGWYKENHVKPSFDLNESLRTSQGLYCGCNYRFDRPFIEKAIMFIIEDKDGDFSSWFLLPDNSVLLYIMEGRKVLDYDYTRFGKYPGLQYPCARFDNQGAIIHENNH